MSKLIWSDDLETKVQQIDTHNQSLFFVLNELFASDYPCERLIPVHPALQNMVTTGAG